MIGLIECGDWGREWHSGVINITYSKAYIVLFLFLEEDFKEFYSKLDQSIKRVGIGVEAEDIFPFVDLIEFALNHPSDYWANLSLNWFGDLRSENQILLKDAIHSLAYSTRGTQKLRHKAKHCLKYFKKNT